MSDPSADLREQITNALEDLDEAVCLALPGDIKRQCRGIATRILPYILDAVWPVVQAALNQRDQALKDLADEYACCLVDGAHADCRYVAESLRSLLPSTTPPQ